MSEARCRLGQWNAYKTTFSDQEPDDIVVDFHKLHQSAIFYHLAIQEFEPLGMRTGIVIDDEVPTVKLDLYNAFCYCSLFPLRDRSSVTGLVGDGLVKLKPQCEVSPMKTTGRQRKDPSRNTSTPTGGSYAVIHRVVESSPST